MTKTQTIKGNGKMNHPAASCRASKLIIFYPLTLTLSPWEREFVVTL